MSLLATLEVTLSIVTAALLMAAAWRVRRTRALVPSSVLFNICTVTAVIVLFRSAATILDHEYPGASAFAALPIRFALLGTAVYIATFTNGRKHE